jgi:hypothetical protein
VNDGVPGVEVLVVSHGEERALPVYSGEGKAELHVWLGDAFEDGWNVRESSAGEHASILYGPCAGVGSVALDPSPGIEAEMVGLLRETRGRFVGRVRRCSSCPGRGEHHHTRGSLRSRWA